VYKKASEAKGIFCLEGDWWNDLKRSASTESALRLLKDFPPRYAPYIHRDVATRAEFDYYVQKWLQVAHSNYPILYLAFHGTPGTIQFGDMRKQENIISLDELEERLLGGCKGRIVYFSSCDTMGENGNRLRSFLRRTQALAVCGYRSDVDWLASVAFDLLFLGQTQFNAFTVAGMRAIERRILEDAGGLARKLGFHMVVNDR
jgi:hypothetical protein